MGLCGVGLLPTVIAAPVVLGLEIVAHGVLGNLSAGALQSKPKSMMRSESWQRVSLTLMDGKISDEEFHLIVDKVDKYKQR